MLKISVLFTCTIFLLGCGSEPLSPPIGHGEPLRLHTKDGFGPINNGFGASGVLTLADWDGDGWNDLIVFSGGYRDGLFLFCGIRTEGIVRFEAQERIDGNYGLPAFSKLGVIPTRGHKIGASWWLDVDGNGLADLLSNTADGFVVFINCGEQGKPFFGPAQKISLNLSNRICFADLDGDGVKDLIQGVNGEPADYFPKYNAETMTPGATGPVYPGKYEDGVWLGHLPKGQVMFYRGLGGMRFAPGRELLESSLLEHTVGGLYPAAGDWDGDRDLDLALTDQAGGLYLFENIGGRKSPCWKPGAVRHFPYSGLRAVMGKLRQGQKRDGLFLLTESAFIFWLGPRGDSSAESFPFEEPAQLECRRPALSAGNFCVPTVAEMNGDGIIDLIAGNEDGYLMFFAGVRSATPFQFGRPELIKAGGGDVLYLPAGPTGSPQGPLEAAYGYTCPKAGDWDMDGKNDIVFSDIRGYMYLLRNTTENGALSFAPVESIYSEGDILRTVWRVRPVIWDVNRDGLPDLVTLNRWGQLSWYERIDKGNILAAPQIFLNYWGNPVKLDAVMGRGHYKWVHSGRIKLELADWDGDGDADLIYGTSRMVEPYEVVTTKQGGYTHIAWMENVGSRDQWVFRKWGALLNTGGIPVKLGWHTACPEAVDWNSDGKLDLIVSTENGRVYLYDRDFIDQGCKVSQNCQQLGR